MASWRNRICGSRVALTIALFCAGCDSIAHSGSPPQPTSRLAVAANPLSHGATPTTSPTSAGVAKVICSICGAENEPGAKFCKHCGAKAP